MLSHYVQISSSIHARLFDSVRSACLSGGAGSLRSIYCLSLRLHALPFLCALGHNNGSEVCASSECPDEIASAQARLSCRCSHYILVCLLVGM